MWQLATRWIVPADGSRYGAGVGVAPQIPVSVDRKPSEAPAAPGEPATHDASNETDALPSFTLANRELVKRVGRDPVLIRAADTLLGLRALDRHPWRAPIIADDLQDYIKVLGSRESD